MAGAAALRGGAEEWVRTFAGQRLAVFVSAPFLGRLLGYCCEIGLVEGEG